MLCIRGPRESLQQGSAGRAVVLYMRISGIVEKYVKLVQNMYEGTEIVMRGTVGTTESFKVKVGPHQGSVLSPFLFAVIMDRLTDEVRRKLPWMMLFADDTYDLRKDQGRSGAEIRILEVCIGKMRDESK